MAALTLQRSTRIEASLIVGVSLFSLVLAIIPTLGGRLPQPNVHDEFANLLAADTFVHGRLTNPPPRDWEFFESFHVLVQPTYASKFPPGQGLALALGQWLGRPIIGVWLVVAAACGATTWMLRAVLPARWAGVGGLVMAGHPLVLWWTQNYWGGGVALLGGALVGGATLRIARLRDLQIRWGVIGGVGGALLLISRPFEGLIVCGLLAAAVTLRAWRRQRLARLIKIAPAGLLIVIGAVCWTGYYNWRVTGSAWQLPYTLNARQYMIAPLMFWQHPSAEPVYRHSVMRHFYRDHELAEYISQTNWRGYLGGVWSKFKMLAGVFIRVWALPLAPLAASLFVFRRRAVQLGWLILIGLPLLQALCTPWMRNQYMAPGTSWFFLLVAVGLCRIDRSTVAGVRLGRTIVSLLLMLCSAQTVLTERNFLAPPRADGEEYARRQMLDDLNTRGPGRRLIFVRHSPTGTTAEAVYNGADPAAANNLFVHDMGDVHNRQIIADYPERSLWLLSMDGFRLSPYAPASPSSAGSDRR